MIAVDAPCPCQSGLVAGNCCMPEIPPVARRGEGYTKMNIGATLVRADGVNLPLPTELAVRLGFRTPHQLDAGIGRRMEEIMVNYTGSLDALTATLIQSGRMPLEVARFCERMQALDDALHTVRYHQRQFFARYRILYVENALQHDAATSQNVEILVDDMPLRYELQAFLTSTRSVLDVMCQGATLAMGRKPMGYGVLQKHLTSGGYLPTEAVKRLRRVFKKHASWIEQTSGLRHAIVHEAKFEAFSGFGWKRSRLVEPILLDVSADHLGFRVWRDLQALVCEVFATVLPSAPPM